MTRRPPTSVLTRCSTPEPSTSALSQRAMAVMCAMVAVTTFVRPAAGIPRQLLKAVPANATAAVVYDPVDEIEPKTDSILTLATLLLERGREMGFAERFGESVGRTLDIVGSLPVVAHRPLAMVLLDVASEPRPGGGAQLSSLSAGLVIDTDGHHDAIARRVRFLLGIYTNDVDGRIEEIEANGHTSYRLTDSRLPEWAVMEWGAIGKLYVLTLGTGVFDRISASLRGSAPSLATAEWSANAHLKTAGADASLQAYLNVRRLLGSLGASARKRAEEVLSSLRLRSATRGLWSIGQDGRAVRILSVLEVGGEDRFIPISTSTFADFPLDSVIPPEAKCFLIVETGAEELVLHVRDTYLDTITDSTRRKLLERWAREEEVAGVSVQRDLVSQLGRHVVFHPYPPHPLGIPLLCTILIEIDGSKKSVQRGLDSALEHYRNLPSRPSDQAKASPASWLRRDSDGVWYVQFGVIGPAIGVTDNWIVIGYSPQAVRLNIEYLQSQ